MSSLIIIKVLRDFKEGLHPNLDILNALKIKYFSETPHFSQMLDIHVSLLIHRIFTSESNVHHKLLILQEIGNES